MHCMTWYTSTCGKTAMSLLYRLDPIVIEIYFYVIMVLESNDCFVTNTPFTNGGRGGRGPDWSGFTRFLQPAPQ